MADKMQMCLDRTAHRVRWLWLHMLFYSSWQLILSARRCTALLRQRSWEHDDVMLALLDILHCIIGAAIFFCTLFTPACTTFVYSKTPHRILEALQNRGC